MRKKAVDLSPNDISYKEYLLFFHPILLFFHKVAKQSLNGAPDSIAMIIRNVAWMKTKQ